MSSKRTLYEYPTDVLDLFDALDVFENGWFAREILAAWLGKRFTVDKQPVTLGHRHAHTYSQT